MIIIKKVNRREESNLKNEILVKFLRLYALTTQRKRITGMAKRLDEEIETLTEEFKILQRKRAKLGVW